MSLELISFPLCPYVQRSVITLLHKEIAFTLTHIDLAHKPDWFRELAPHGKVPCLRVNGGPVLFESQVINEYLDETTPPPLMPEAPLERARHRAWIAMGSDALADQFQMMSAQGEERFTAASRQLFDKLERLEKELQDPPFFAGEQFGLVDAAFAPLFMRMEILHSIRPLQRWEALDRLRRWTAVLMELPEVAGSVTAEFPAQLYSCLSEKGSLLLRTA